MSEEKRIEDIKLYTLHEIQPILKVSYRTLQNYIKDGKLKGAKIGGKWRITEENLSTSSKSSAANSLPVKWFLPSHFLSSNKRSKVSAVTSNLISYIAITPRLGIF